MGLLGGLIKTAVDVVTIPVDIAKDVGDVLDGQDPKNTENKVNKVLDDIL